jgi:hypothetical protein
VSADSPLRCGPRVRVWILCGCVCDCAGPKGEDADSKLVVAGMQAGVEAACAVIEAVIAENYTVSVPVENPDVISYLVGPKGESIKKFQVIDLAPPLHSRFI